jgi:GNAT superfamily N-acetyltransferase
MITLDAKINLLAVKLHDQGKLLDLMLDIYPAVYSHLWQDQGDRYLRKVYSQKNLCIELKNANARYYFVQYEGEVVGILRVILGETMPGWATTPMVKLERIYLSPAVHGKGIGKRIFQWVEEEFCIESKIPLWLEAMDSQPQAIGFYEKMGFGEHSRFRFEEELMKDEYRGMIRMVKQY